MKKSVDVELEVRVKAVTNKAILVSTDGSNQVWLPKSQISDWSDSEELDHHTTSIFVPEWLAIEKGLV
jgi:hypothetical protein